MTSNARQRETCDSSIVYLQVCVDHPYLSLLTYSYCAASSEKLSSFLYRRVEVFIDEHGRQKKNKAIVVRVFASLADVIEINAEKKSFDIKTISRFIDKEAIVTQEQSELAQELADYYQCSWGQMLFAMLPAGRRYTAVQEKEQKENHFSLPALNEEQETAYQKILHSSPQKIHTHLLYGVTGSGKTRLYIELIKRYMEKNYSVIFLIPEIAISYQIYSVLKPIFQETLAYLHSSLSTSSRLREYKKIQHGKAKVILGTRSAVFAPAQNLALIIFDEEHDASFKQNRKPRYNAKRVAYMRLQKILQQTTKTATDVLPLQIVLGSATPSVESYYLATQNIFQLHRLQKRATGFLQPQLFLSSLNLYHDEQIFTSFTVEKMRQHLQKGNQIFIILNRRGHSNYAFCRNCHKSEGCPHCSVALTYHQKNKSNNANGVLKCHLCGFEKPYNGECSSCGKKLKLVGKGIQKIENVLEKNFSDIPFARLDQDSAAERGYSQEILEAMRAEKIQILLGTQMIAKGFDMPKVTLVVIANADHGLHLPDFRSGERVFQLLVQSSGRSGRHSRGEVIVQSADPDHYVLQSVLYYDYEAFYQKEINLRKTFGYPPFKKLLRFLVLSKNEVLLQELKEKLLHWLDELQSPLALFSENSKEQLPQEILPPQEAPLYRLNSDYRVHLLAKDVSHEKLLAFAWQLNGFAKRYVQSHADTRYEIDMDPLDIL